VMRTYARKSRTIREIGGCIHFRHTRSNRVQARQRERAAVTNLWHDHCTFYPNWDFSAQLENRALPGPVFRARQRFFIV
jgi:hypothetical protein